jgi:DNA-directed RNA polymerase subunit N (RpoN/RPB10)
MSGKLLSLFDHPEFVRRVQEREAKELGEALVPVVRLGLGRFRCRRCSLEYDAVPRLHDPGDALRLEPCPHCERSRELDEIEAFLSQVLEEP